MLFHEFLRILRQSKEIGMREFAHKIGMDVGNYSRIERGIIAPPQKETVLKKIAKALELNNDDTKKLIALGNLAVGRIPSEIAENMREYEYLPVLLRTIANKQLTDEQLRELTERINKEY